MPVTLPAKTLGALATSAAKYTTSSSLAPVLASTLLEVTQGRVRLSATDTTYTLRASLPCESTELWSALVDAKRLSAALKVLSGDVSLSLSGRDLTLKAGKARVTLPCTDPAEYVDLPTAPEGAEHPVDAHTLSRALGAVLPASSTNPTRPNLVTVSLEAEDGKLTCVATDGHRLHVARTSLDWTHGSVLLGADGARHFLAALKGAGAEADVSLAIAGSSCLLRVDTTEVHARLSAEKFPPWRAVVPSGDPQSTVTLDPAPLVDALKRARLAAGDESQPAAVFSCEREGDTELTVRASAEGASTEEAVPAHVDGLLPPTGLALTYLADALEALGADSVTLVARSPRAAVVLEPAQPDPHVNVTCVVMPRRV